MKAAFVYAVCGKAKYLDELQVSLRHLQRYSAADIVVVTDNQRNAYPLVSGGRVQVVQVDTPAQMTNKRAAIYLKTHLYQFVDWTRYDRFAYLDSDVLALQPRVDALFDLYQEPISFVPDHYYLSYFSSWAVGCQCHEYVKVNGANLSREEFQRRRQLVQHFLDTYHQKFQPMNQFIELERKRMDLVNARYHHIKPRHYYAYMRKQGFECSDKEGSPKWFTVNGDFVRNEYYPPFDQWLETRGFRQHPEQPSVWLDASGEVFLELNSRYTGCAHLQEKLAEVYGVHIPEDRWRHWNGGLFLFTEASIPFLARWAEYTDTWCATLPELARDQPALIATVWSLGLQHHPTLDLQWNFIADKHTPGLEFNAASGTFHWTDAAGTPQQAQPMFIHLFYGIGDRSWPVWNWVEQRG
jgi:hypothetical protein